MCPGDLAQFSLGLLGWKVTLGGSREHESWALLLVWCWDSFQGPAAVDSQSAALPTQELGPTCCHCCHLPQEVLSWAE